MFEPSDEEHIAKCSQCGKPTLCYCLDELHEFCLCAECEKKMSEENLPEH